MDIFRFNNPVASTKFEDGEIINGLKSVLWVEKFADTGEFTLVADVSSGMKDILPIGTYISHTDTTEVMVVENHEIKDQAGEESEIVITGRGYDSLLEHKFVGSNCFSPDSGGFQTLALPPYTLPLQIVFLIQLHIGPLGLAHADDNLEYTTVVSEVGGVLDELDRAVPLTDLLVAVRSLLDIGGYGIKTVRPGTWTPDGVPDGDIAYVIYEGRFGDPEDADPLDIPEGLQVENAQYLWTSKTLKTVAFVTGTYVNTRVDIVPGDPNYDHDNRRVMRVDGTDIDPPMIADIESGITIPELEAINVALQQRGLDALYSQKFKVITSAQSISEVSNRQYRIDFLLGDIITAHGNYNESTLMQVTEYVESLDENGKSGHPTLVAV